MTVPTFFALALRNGISSFGVMPIRRVPDVFRRDADEMLLLFLADVMASALSLIIA